MDFTIKRLAKTKRGDNSSSSEEEEIAKPGQEPLDLSFCGQKEKSARSQDGVDLSLKSATKDPGQLLDELRNARGAKSPDAVSDSDSDRLVIDESPLPQVQKSSFEIVQEQKLTIEKQEREIQSLREAMNQKDILLEQKDRRIKQLEQGQTQSCEERNQSSSQERQLSPGESHLLSQDSQSPSQMQSHSSHNRTAVVFVPLHANYEYQVPKDFLDEVVAKSPSHTVQRIKKVVDKPDEWWKNSSLMKKPGKNQVDQIEGITENSSLKTLRDMLGLKYSKMRFYLAEQEVSVKLPTSQNKRESGTGKQRVPAETTFPNDNDAAFEESEVFSALEVSALNETLPFMALIRNLTRNSGLFDKIGDCLTFSHNASFADNGRYHVLGSLVGWSILHGGPGLHALAPETLRMLDEERCDLRSWSKYVPDEKLKTAIDLMDQATTDEWGTSLLLCCNVFEDLGFHDMCRWKFEAKAECVNSLLRYVICYRNAKAVSDFKNGLNAIGGLWSLFLEHPVLKQQLLGFSPSDISATTVKDLLDFNHAEEGSNDRVWELQTEYSLRMFIDDAEEGEIDGLTLEDVLCWLCGCKRIPPLGLESKIFVRWFDMIEGEMRYPKTSTCGLTLELPRGKRDGSDAVDSFEEYFKTAVVFSKDYFGHA